MQSRQSAPAAVAVAVCLTLCAPPTTAGDPSLPPLTIEEAIELALRYNETPRIGAAQVERAHALREAVVAELWPALNAGATATRRANEVTRTVGGETITVQARNAYASVATLDSVLFDAQTLTRIKAADQDVRARQETSFDQDRLLAFEVSDVYFAVLSAQKLADAARGRLEVATATLEDARARFDAGLAARNEVTRIELEQATAQLTLTQAESTVAKSRLRLEYLLAAPVDRPLVEPPPAPPETRPIEELDGIALERRPDLKALLALAEGSRLRARAERQGFIPDLGFLGTARLTNESGLSGNDTDWNFAATLGWSIFDRGRIARAATFDAQRSVDLYQAEALRRQIGNELRVAQQDLVTAQASYAQAEVQARVARQNEEEVAERFANGLATALEQADANVALFEAEANLARQGFARWLAEQALQRALGAWPLGRENWIDREGRE
ncbi:MAG: TolC family protein [Acidobacteria bacterium]|jgi:outer membrane protein TolC|nr:TolC family protein [Acidobacteriota bacterium]MCU0253806.1 TolC family protein [Acidobacteriota bacterium]